MSSRTSGGDLAVAVGTSLMLALGACGFRAAPSGTVAEDASPADAVPGRGDAPLDAPGVADATLAMVVLSETSSDVVAPGTSVVCYAPGAQSTRDGTWRRVFRPSDFGVAGALEVSQVAFGVDHALNARGIGVRVGTYAGSFGAATLDPSQIAPLASTTVDVPDVESPQRVTALISAQVPAGALLVVDVAAPSLQGTGHLNLGATSGSETAPGYFSSVACSVSPPQSAKTIGGTGSLVIDVVGTRQ